MTKVQDSFHAKLIAPKHPPLVPFSLLLSGLFTERASMGCAHTCVFWFQSWSTGGKKVGNDFIIGNSKGPR